jgi:hypothetical protein
MADASPRHAFLNRQNVHNGRRPTIGIGTLDNVLTMYRELRDNDRIVTLNMIVAEVRRMDSGSKDLHLSAIHCQIYRHLRKYGVIGCHITHVAQNTKHDEDVKSGYVAFVNAGLKAETYKASGIVNIDEMNVDFDLVSGSTLAGRVEKTIWCATPGSYSRCTVLLGATMDREKLLPYIIFKGASTPLSLIKTEFKDVEAIANYGYPEGQFYNIQ